MRTIAIGFRSGHTVTLRLEEDRVEPLREAVRTGEGHELAGEEAIVTLAPDQVAFLRVEAEERRTGF